jgi:hypothetical protein
MNIKEIAHKLIALREGMAAFIMSGQLREELGYEGYGEALARRWIMADEEASGMVQITNHLGTVAEMRQLSEEFVKEEGEECEFCHKKGKECTCTKCSDCGKANCKCESVREAAILAQAHAARPRLNLREIATMGLGNPDRQGTPPAQPNVDQPLSPTAQPTTATPARTEPVNIGSSVRVVQDGKSYVGLIKAVGQDGKFEVSFGGPDKPPVARTYDKSEVTPVTNAVQK